MKVKPKAAEIVGIVHPLGAGGGQTPPEKNWTLRFSVQPWRGTDGAIQEWELSVCKPNLTDKMLHAMMDSIEPFEILRLRVRLEVKKDGLGRPIATLVKMLGKTNADAELTARAEQMQKPVTIKHPLFGTLTLNRALDWLEATSKWGSKKINLYFSRKGRKDDQPLLRLAEELWKKQKTWDKQVHDMAVKKLLDLKNDLWLGDKEKEFTPQRFKKRMKLQSILIEPKGAIEFTFNDGNLFWGHVIQVWGTLKKGPTDAGIAG